MAAELEDLDEVVRRHDPDRWLASRFIADVKAREDVIALYAFDHELSKIPDIASDPIMREIRLTWWVEVLDEIFDGRPVRKHPVTLALAKAIERRKIPREQFDAILEPRFENVRTKQAGPTMRVAAYILSGEWHLTGAAAEAWMHHSTGDLVEANENLRDLPAKAFPAVAYATLARLPQNASEFRKRLRLTWATLRGKL